MIRFEVVIHNQQVRDKVREGEHHKALSDDWSDSHYIEISAKNEEDALVRARNKYPSEGGFVIEGVSEV